MIKKNNRSCDGLVENMRNWRLDWQRKPQTEFAKWELFNYTLDIHSKGSGGDK